MKVKKLIPILYTENLQATVDFYVSVLGFQSNTLDADPTWACLQLNAVEIMISKPNEHISFTKPYFTGSFYFRVEEVNNLWEKLKDRCNVCYPLENFEYGMREFAIYDNNNYLLQFGEEIEQ